MTNIQVIGVDKGPGITDPNKVLQGSIEVHHRSAYYIYKTGWIPDKGLGFRNIFVFPDEATIETNGIKWIRIGKVDATIFFRGDEISDIDEGTKITLVWSVREPGAPEPETVPEPTPELSMSQI